jgi:hypothetical protein
MYIAAKCVATQVEEGIGCGKAYPVKLSFTGIHNPINLPHLGYRSFNKLLYI